MRKFKHKATGDVAEQRVWQNQKDYTYVMKTEEIFEIPRNIIENSSDWEEIEELCVPVGTRFKTKVSNYYTIDSVQDNQVKVVWDKGFLNYSISAANTLFECGDWIKVEDKDYEILSFKNISNDVIFKKCIDGNFNCIDDANFGHYGENSFIQEEHFVINSVRRLSDNEVFTLNDYVENPAGLKFCIDKFYLDCNNKYLLVGANNGNGHIRLNKIKKAKIQPLFITEDGKEIFTGDEYFYVVESNLDFLSPWTPKGHVADWSNSGLINRPPLGAKQFSTKEAAQEYIDYNKPKYSLKDLKEVADGRSAVHIDWIINKLKGLDK